MTKSSKNYTPKLMPSKLNVQMTPRTQWIYELEYWLTEAETFVSLFLELQNSLQINLITMCHELASS